MKNSGCSGNYFQKLLSSLTLCTQGLFHWGEAVTRDEFGCNFSKEKSELVIGILSAPENFAQREAARSTWLKDYASDKKNSVKAWFVIGNHFCKIPPDYRLSKYGCEKWNVNISDLEESFYTSLEMFPETCCSNLVHNFYPGFSFQVQYPVVISKLGILSSLFLPNKKIKVAILDIQTKEILVQTTMSANKSTPVHGYVYAEVEKFVLPKHYEGMVFIEGYLKTSVCSKMIWNNGGGVITYKRVYPTASHMDSIKFSSEHFVAASVEFSIPEMNKLKDIAVREELITAEWHSHLDNLKTKLELEKQQNNDILLVDVTDTYRNLPRKLLSFYKWLEYGHKFSYVMKTDDDCVIDILSILQKLQSSSVFHSERPCLWSSFRKEWNVNYIGKWADYDYRSPFYPAFPCGAVYLLSHKAATWISSNAEYLFPYQGEDVSMGIWLSAINADFIQDDNFKCDLECNSESYNRAQLTLDQIYEVWHLFEKCQNLCTCK
ncbi:UDP-GalNAc:beta-1,3-N-acetylgalactosaminyltransferase 2-like isoform X2 [Stegodyphus dumicola]|uniref:UDP-GalNAc:beta-1, 3-N-acetylgalactosaminyltransferase 2-like isoform X2 n=1 Tax=Stegodyphus dumicola TaxID=202533 RepID=UPI0015B2CFDB|nr:UDP-GalNAc:beta-1,3-N-acetylgalactosaminyltransferase 2-like isoform X2 [Stegodyphus dumicola]